jgi:metal transporter CNNM
LNENNGEFVDFTEIEDVYNFLMVIVCVISADLAAGLTMGLLSLDLTKLAVKSLIGNEEEKSAAISLIPIVKQHHLLLVTLLLFNSIANETLPIFLGAIVPNYLAVILSVTLVLIFGEIIPSALFTGPHQLLTAAKNEQICVLFICIFLANRLSDQ